jgi:DNA-binding transcriptional regulator PaaX
MAVKKRKLRKVVSRAKGVLCDIAETFEFIYAASPYRMPPDVTNLTDYRLWKSYKEWQSKRKQLYELKRRKLIEAQRQGERMMIRLTDKGYREVLRVSLRDTKKKCAAGVCLVTFDIPESEKIVRDTFRRLLRESGFRKLHHSVWFTENDVIEPLCAFVRSNKLTPWVYVFTGKVVSAEKRSMIK